MSMTRGGDKKVDEKKSREEPGLARRTVLSMIPANSGCTGFQIAKPVNQSLYTHTRTFNSQKEKLSFLTPLGGEELRLPAETVEYEKINSRSFRRFSRRLVEMRNKLVFCYAKISRESKNFRYYYPHNATVKSHRKNRRRVYLT